MINVRRSICIVAALLPAIAASARQPDGTLGLLQTPNNGMPAIVRPGDTFIVTALHESTIGLQAPEGTTELQVEWSGLPGGKAKGLCTVPATVAPGTYALEAKTADTADTNLRSVYVIESFPSKYVVAHVTDTHIGTTRHKRPSEDIVRDVFAAVNGTDAAFALITGDLTESGEIEQYVSFLSVLDTCTKPTFVCAGNHDRKELNYERFFGPDVYSFRFGDDGYLSFDTKDFLVADDLSGQATEIQLQRRAIKSARWSIGFTHRYEMDMGMRAQLALFVDDPLDYLIFGHWHRENNDKEKSVPWDGWRGPTKITVTPAAINGEMRFFDVDKSAVTPRPVQTEVNVNK
ncbi:MAG: metallophosphoesterase [Candidatus Hydrogenedentes bacterium]|nr:metallophosphoesterase [Candidatus Hydrogenedentota bacterium]